jgi:methionine synthase / methylenetetrahydrofolate reductase(NADPH)
MGTQIYSAGIDLDQCFDEINLLHPDIIASIHTAYAKAGADIIETNTFSATPIHLERWNLSHRTTEINRAGAQIARTVAHAQPAGQDVLVAGSIGPTGARLAPLGPVRPDEVYRAFYTQIAALVDGGVDYLLLETFSDLNEVEQAIRAARDLCALPIAASITFNREAKTLTGVTPEIAVRKLVDLGVSVIGANCSTGPRGVFEVVSRYRRALDDLGSSHVYVSAMPNAGYPENRGERLFYPATPEYFANYARRFLEAGANIVGGCCGTTPEHIGGMRGALDATLSASQPGNLLSRVTINTPQAGNALDTPAHSGETALARALRDPAVFIKTVEMEPPRSTDTRDLEKQSALLRDAGATVLDISDIPMARMRMTGLAAALKVQQSTGLETILHFPVRGRNLLRVQGDLLAAHALNVRNLFVTMGDPASIGDYPQAFDNHDIVPTGLVQLIKQQFNTGTDSAGASIGAPCSFVVGVAANLTPSDPDKEAKLLKKKIDCGADFALTQPVFDVAAARAFIAHYESQFGELDLPILAGMLPLASPRHAIFLKNEVPGMLLPDPLIARMEAAGEQAREEGVRIATETLAALRGLVKGVYFIPAFKRFDLIARLIASLPS